MKRSICTAAVGAALAGVAALGPASAAADPGSGERHVSLEDDCDPVTFDAALGAGACGGGGDTTFEELIDSLVAREPDGHWRNHPRGTHVDRGRAVHVHNTGGEFHTFTEVAAFGPGCVPQINELLGLQGPPAADCAAAFGDPQTALPAHASGTISTAGLSVGLHRFECMVHPWMRTTVEVRRR